MCIYHDCIGIERLELGRICPARCRATPGSCPSYIVEGYFIDNQLKTPVTRYRIRNGETSTSHQVAFQSRLLWKLFVFALFVQLVI